MIVSASLSTIAYGSFSFKTFLNEEVLDNYGGKKMYATNHFIDRKKERGANDAEVKHIFRSAVDHLNQNP